MVKDIPSRVKDIVYANGYSISHMRTDYDISRWHGDAVAYIMPAFSFMIKDLRVDVDNVDSRTTQAKAIAAIRTAYEVEVAPLRGTVEFHVRNQETGAAVEDAIITMDKSSAKTDNLGSSTWTNIELNRTYSVTVKKGGFEDKAWLYTPTEAINKVDVPMVPTKIIVPVAYVYKVLDPPTPIFKGRGLELYQQLDTALFDKNVAEVKRILTVGLDVEMSPIVFTAAAILIVKVATIIAGVLGSIGFAEFLMEESLQTTDFAITAASKEKNWELEGKALAKKSELLDRNIWETIIGYIPLVNVIAAAWKYFEASKTKHEIDLELWKNKAEATGVNPDVSLQKAADAIARGEDPSQYLPTATSETIPEIINGSVTGVVDGDTIEVTDTFGRLYRIRLIGIDAPEFTTTKGKAATTYLTDRIIHKTVAVKVDPNNRLDPYKRVLGVVFLNGVDVNKEMLSSGHANYYVIGSSKYYSDEEYQAAVKRTGKVSVSSKPTYCKIYVDGVDTGKLTTETLELIEGTYMIGCAKEGYRAESRIVVIEKDKAIEERFELTATALGEEEVIPTIPEEVIPVVEKVKFKIYFTSTPANAKLYIDDVYTHHWTPSNEKELSDVIHLLTIGTHRIKVTKAGMMAEKTITVTEGDNGTHHLDLETVGLPPAVPEVVPVVEPDVKAKIAEIEKLLKELKDFIGL